MTINFNELRLALNLWAQPLFLLAASLVAQLSSDDMPPMLKPLSVVVQWGALGLFAAGMGLLALSAWKLWSASRGRGAICFHCGAPTRFIASGRWGPYRRCMACGTAERADL